MPNRSRNQDEWEWCGPRRKSLALWKVVVVAGAIGVVAVALILLRDMPIRGVWPGGGDPITGSDTTSPEEYVRQHVQVQTDSQDYLDPRTGQLVVEVTVVLLNTGEKPVRGLTARVSLEMLSSGESTPIRTVRPLDQDRALAPGGTHRFTVRFDDFAQAPTGPARVTVALADPVI